ncbi:MAG: hypothetical protein ABJE47_19415 [bacterium]
MEDTVVTTPATPATPVAAKPSSMIRPAVALLAVLAIMVLVVFVGTLVVATVLTERGVNPLLFHPPVYLATVLVLTAAGSLFGGFATSRITSDRSFFTVFVLGLLLFVSAVVPVLRGTPLTPGDPAWYPLAVSVLSPVGVLIGGALERWRMRGPLVKA